MKLTLKFLLLTSVLLGSSIYAEENNNPTCQKIFNHFSKDDQHVYYRGTRLFSADPNTFEVIKNSDYSKDANSVYYEAIRIAGADPESFELVNNSNDYKIYARDKYRVYLKETVIEGANPQYFEEIKGSFYRDDRHVFYGGYKLKKANPKEFILYTEARGGLGRDSLSLYDIGFGIHGGLTISIYSLKDLGIENLPEFTYLGSSYFTDHQNIYKLFAGELIRLESPTNGNLHYITDDYFHDGTKVYLYRVSRRVGELIPLDADLESFQYSNDHYVQMFQDKHGCFSREKRISCEPLLQERTKKVSYNNSQPNQMKVLANCDNKLEYRLTANPFNLVPLTISNNDVSYGDITIKNVDIPTFEYIGSMSFKSISDQNYFRDKHHVYLNGKIIKGIIPKTFVLLSDFRAQDREQILYGSTLKLLTEKE